MAEQVLILGGRGRIGSSIAADLLTYTAAQVTVTGRASHVVHPLVERFGSRLQYRALDLADRESLRDAIASTNLVVHCAGPFRQQDTVVLATCIEQGINYVDVSDDRVFTQAALNHGAAAEAAEVTAVVNTGVFPGISNSMVRQGIEQLDQPQEVHISYVVAGSGGAGVTVMRTTFLNIQHSFDAWIENQWQKTEPYTGRETVEFPSPFGKANVYWFDMPESFTLAQTFPIKTVTTKFGTAPNFYNYLTWVTAHWFPKALMRQPQFVEFLAHVSHRMTRITDRFSGTGVAMQVDIKGQKNGKPMCYSSAFVHESAVVATGMGTGSISQLILSGQINQAGVFPVEQVLSTPIFEQISASRGIILQQNEKSLHH